VQLTDIVSHTPGVVSRVIDGEAVLVDPKQGMVRVLNPTGARIWELIDGQGTVAGLAAALAEEYGIDSARAQADVLVFCDDLVRRGVLSVTVEG
jgi:hypothetical protein